MDELLIRNEFKIISTWMKMEDTNCCRFTCCTKGQHEMTLQSIETNYITRKKNMKMEETDGFAGLLAY